MDKSPKLDAAGMAACPFCGQRGAATSLRPQAGCWHAKCIAFIGDSNRVFATVEEAVATWNRRAPAQPAPGGEGPREYALRELAEDMLRKAIRIAEEPSPKWYKNSDAKIEAIKALKSKWDDEAASIIRATPAQAKGGGADLEDIEAALTIADRKTDAFDKAWAALRRLRSLSEGAAPGGEG